MHDIGVGVELVWVLVEGGDDPIDDEFVEEVAGDDEEELVHHLDLQLDAVQQGTNLVGADQGILDAQVGTGLQGVLHYHYEQDKIQ